MRIKTTSAVFLMLDLRRSALEQLCQACFCSSARRQARGHEGQLLMNVAARESYAPHPWQHSVWLPRNQSALREVRGYHGLSPGCERVDVSPPTAGLMQPDPTTGSRSCGQGADAPHRQRGAVCFSTAREAAHAGSAPPSRIQRNLPTILEDK